MREQHPRVRRGDQNHACRWSMQLHCCTHATPHSMRDQVPPTYLWLSHRAKLSHRTIQVNNAKISKTVLLGSLRPTRVSWVTPFFSALRIPFFVGFVVLGLPGGRYFYTHERTNERTKRRTNERKNLRWLGLVLNCKQMVATLPGAPSCSSPHSHCFLLCRVAADKSLLGGGHS